MHLRRETALAVDEEERNVNKYTEECRRSAGGPRQRSEWMLLPFCFSLHHHSHSVFLSKLLPPTVSHTHTNKDARARTRAHTHTHVYKQVDTDWDTLAALHNAHSFSLLTVGDIAVPVPVILLSHTGIRTHTHRRAHTHTDAHTHLNTQPRNTL